jgi:hypothetical protein
MHEVLGSTSAPLNKEIGYTHPNFFPTNGTTKREVSASKRKLHPAMVEK